MNKVNYSGYEVDASSKELLLSIFPPLYKRAIGHHITTDFGPQSELPEEANIYVVGYVNSGDGLEALVCEVNGKIQRPDGGTFHITWSLEGNYKPVNSNDVLAGGWVELFLDIPIRAEPKLF